MKKELTMKIIEKYHIFLIKEERSHSTIEKYMRDIMKFYTFLADDKTLTKEKVIHYKQSLINQYKTTSLNSMLVAVNGLLDFMNLSQCKVKLNKIQRRLFVEEKQELTKKEYAKLLKAAQLQNDEKLLMIMQTICATGIRVSEHQYITVESLKKGISTIHNKGKVREIIFPKKLRKSLLNYCQKMNIKSGPVFITRTGKPVNRSNIWTMMKKLCETAGVNHQKVYPHNLRHLFAFTFYNVKKDLVRLADVLGHASIETTRIYTKTSIKHCQDIFNKMNLDYIILTT